MLYNYTENKDGRKTIEFLLEDVELKKGGKKMVVKLKNGVDIILQDGESKILLTDGTEIKINENGELDSIWSEKRNFGMKVRRGDFIETIHEAVEEMRLS